MPQQEIFVTLRNGERWRQCVLRTTCDDDPPERAEAVAFFNHERLFPDIHKFHHVLRIDELSLDDAQAYLDAHPIRVPWKRLRLEKHATLKDDDLERLKYVPELEEVDILTDQISDDGIVHLQHLRQIKRLCLNSRNVTDRSLTVIRNLVSLKILDLQGAPNVSAQAFADTVALLPNLVDSYAPHPEHTPEPIQEFDELYDDLRQPIIFGTDP
jgi:hypothetical protein